MLCCNFEIWLSWNMVRFRPFSCFPCHWGRCRCLLRCISSGSMRCYGCWRIRNYHFCCLSRRKIILVHRDRKTLGASRDRCLCDSWVDPSEVKKIACWSRSFLTVCARSFLETVVKAVNSVTFSSTCVQLHCGGWLFWYCNNPNSLAYLYHFFCIRDPEKSFWSFSSLIGFWFRDLLKFLSLF